ncbi:response regulator [Taibaiella lutea]|uniref:Response regulator n=1 Tax=Taibaiella lutea TaxID=2608001 RepID=A0A5M6CLT6_9BACT|nr:response regulator [Taibaiella lutea]KAA5536188.1 response regulator [Taibaiella lutea]
MAKKILIIDDDKDILEMLNIVFQDSEFDVVLSNTGMTADEIKVIHPDIVLLDVKLRNYKLNGDEICMEIKSREDMNYIPVLLVSSENNLRILAEDCNADGYIAKPFDVKNLMSAVRCRFI